MAGDRISYHCKRRLGALPRAGERGEIHRPWADIVRDLRWRILSERSRSGGGRRRFRGGGIPLSNPVRVQGLSHSSARQIARLQNHGRSRPRAPNDRADLEYGDHALHPNERGEMRAIDLRNVITHEERELPVACVFVAIGHDPNAKPYGGKLEMDKDGYLITKRLVESKHPGVFIAGDVADRLYKQAVTAAGAGCAAAIEAERYLSSLEK